jgi:hypothetical protein
VPELPQGRGDDGKEGGVKVGWSKYQAERLMARLVRERCGDYATVVGVCCYDRRRHDWELRVRVNETEYELRLRDRADIERLEAWAELKRLLKRAAARALEVAA